MSPTPSISDANGRTRRHLLTTVGAIATAGTAGCLGVFGQSKPIKEASFKPFDLVVSLRSDAGIDKLSFIAPDGTALGSKSVASGQTTVKLPLAPGTTYDYKPLPPGDYKIAVAKDGEAKQTKTVTLTRSATITNVKAVRNYDTQRGPTPPNELQFGLKNTGKLPIRLTKFRPLKGIATVGQSSWGSRPGFKRLNAGNAKDARKETVVSGNVGAFQTSYKALILGANSIPKGKATEKQVNKHFCNGQTIDAAFRLTGVNGFQKQHSFKITYSGDSIALGRGFASGEEEFACPNVSVGSKSSQS